MDLEVLGEQIGGGFVMGLLDDGEHRSDSAAFSSSASTPAADASLNDP